ncbi:spore protease YyaC [Evansella cellulosilytica]|uniref:Sporulation protein YyaC n=1 Tax=Evansella cellulosilytica (strain ATCC 21833 / DSM 2522 / FERM P-1141 / JCM 9156 / N-4) TaxID=649639 RepID=E6TZY0_EVAC2|nr:sporulation protein YyaC [Evansella cellulosilytica DSM 2522]
MLSGQLFPQKKNNSFRAHMKQPIVTSDMAKKIYSLLPKDNNQQIIIVCIGTDRSTGDSLGPLVGTKLLERGCKRFPVFGTLEKPVHAKNLEETLSSIQLNYDNPFIIGIDACLGRHSSVGYMTVSEGPVKPGAAVNKVLPDVGNIHITGIVNVNGFMEMMVLQNTRLSLVMDMADIISRAISRAARWLETEPEWLRKLNIAAIGDKY